MRQSSNEGYHSYLKELPKLKQDNNAKEYYSKLRFYSAIDKNTGLLTELSEKKEEGDEEVTIIEDCAEITKRVIEKYKGLCKDLGFKENYEDPKTMKNLIKVTKNDIQYALDRLNFKKATGWDFIPGKVFRIILDETENDPVERDTFLFNMSKLCNQLLDSFLPEEVFSTRLICFNKDARNPGDINAIRPIGINGVISKILEIVVRRKLRKHIYGKMLISNKQVGFVQGLGCEVNLVRLREKAKELMTKGTTTTKFILFIDFKQAYDSVNHKKLFEKLEKLGTPERIINTIKKMLSYANMKMDANGQVIWINNGEVQGGMLSPDLFNIYINDLINILEEAGLNPIAYADDLAVLCDGEDKLNEAINIIEAWGIENDISVNKKKSGLLVIQNNKIDVENIRGYPIKNWYKYLGVRIDYNLSPHTHLVKTKERLEVYIRRNNWLLRDYFSPKSLVQLCDYFQCSRLAYGMCTYLEDPKIMEKLEKTKMMFLRSIMGLKDNVSSNRLRMAINVPKMEFELFVRLKRVIDKYRKHFNEEPTIYTGIMKKFYEDINKYTVNRAEDMDDEELRKSAKRWSIVKLGIAESTEIGKNYFDVTMKSIYKYIDRRDFWLIRYIIKSGFLSEREWTDRPPMCELCNIKITRKHLTNDCPYLTEDREKLAEELGVEPGGDLEEALMKAYYNMSKIQAEKGAKTLAAIKAFLAQFYIKRGKLMDELEEAGIIPKRKKKANRRRKDRPEMDGEAPSAKDEQPKKYVKKPQLKRTKKSDNRKTTGVKQTKKPKEPKRKIN